MTLLNGFIGDTMTFDVALTDGAGAPLNLAGLSLTFTASHPYLTITKTIGDGITVTNEAGGLASIELAPADTEDLEDRMNLVYDLQVSDGLGNAYTAFTGTLIVEIDVTP
jgi:hypothetical protein